MRIKFYNNQRKVKMEDLEPITILDLLKVLADENRLTLLRILSEGECTVGALARLVELSEPTVSHHLTRLRATGLVSLRMNGNQRFYRLNKTGLGADCPIPLAGDVFPARPALQ
jgi:DNA-binding transcriptional ArsR family regulator